MNIKKLIDSDLKVDILHHRISNNIGVKEWLSSFYPLLYKMDKGA
jgi:hypothetical protein